MLPHFIIIITTIIFICIISSLITILNKNTNILSKLKADSKTRIFPFRYFQDSNNNILPIVAVTGFFRDQSALNKYYEYKNNNVHIFGITAYKTFPKNITDGSEGNYIDNDQFPYTTNIKNWMCCFYDPLNYGFTNNNNIIAMSESDFYDPNNTFDQTKKYDFIYICLKDGDQCPLNGWNAINRNYDLALKCFPILFNNFGLKGLVVGRVNCGLEELYKDNIEVTDMLEYHILQEKMAQSRFLFVPNMYDASPRVVSECITKNIPVLMNKNIVCGSKYINYETGEFFNDENDITNALKILLNKINDISPQNWWKENYGIEKSERKLCKFLKKCYNDIPNDVERIKFVL